MGTNEFLRRGTRFLLALGLVGLLLCQTSDAQVTKGKTRPAETKHIMKGLVQANCASLGGLLKEKGPADDKAWEQAVVNASLLNEASFVLMEDGRCPDKDWKGAAETLRGCSGKVLEAVKEKKLEDAQAAFKELTGACGACHKVHRKK
jgi:cytochrome c556